MLLWISLKTRLTRLRLKLKKSRFGCLRLCSWGLCLSRFSLELRSTDCALRDLGVCCVFPVAGWTVPNPFEDAADAECGEGDEFYVEAFADVLY